MGWSSVSIHGYSGLALFLPIAVAVKTQKANRLRAGSESKVPPAPRSFGSLKWPTVGTSPEGDRLKSCRVGFGSLLKTLSHWSHQNRPFRDTLWMLLGVFFLASEHVVRHLVLLSSLARAEEEWTSVRCSGNECSLRD